jgi:Vacuolar sorting protein 9 (VPS9) domain
VFHSSFKTSTDQIRCTTQLASFTERARQWESFSSFRLNVRTYNLCFQLDANDLPTKKDILPATLSTFDEKDFKAYAPSTPTLDLVSDWICNTTSHSDEVSVLSDANSRVDQNDLSMESLSPLLFGPKFPGQHLSQQRFISESSENDIFMPLMGVRKALCVRIVNSFLDQTKTAYTIWVFDVESGREWYAPIRYQQDFQDLRADVIPLCPSLAQIPYPQVAWKVFGREKAETEEVRRTKSRQLEHFLRRLCSILYTNTLNPVISEISMHLQSFLGCDGFDTHHRPKGLLSLNEATIHQAPEASQNKLQSRVRLLLKRAIQRYVYRILLLDEMQTIVNDFVNSTRDREPQLRDIEILESLGRTKLKERSMEELEKIQYFLDQIQSLILEGCRSDFYSICRRSHYNILQPLMEGAKGDSFIDRVLREAVREQIEIEIYVPLRGVVSRLLVNGWKLDDMEIHFKMNELRRRPQTKPSMPLSFTSPSDWSSVSRILSEGVGMSTLPCTKLQAIVHSAREITRLFHTMQGPRDEMKQELGADDFLPIFIYCVIQADMERPCALCVLLRTLCEPTNRIGEIGYYLASFEAALTHIQEINLSDD